MSLGHLRGSEEICQLTSEQDLARERAQCREKIRSASRRNRFVTRRLIEYWLAGLGLLL